MGEALRAGLAFAAKDLRQIRRESRAWVTFAIALVSMATFAALTSGDRREAIGLQLLYLSPAIVVGTFFTRCIDAEVRVFVILRMIVRSTRTFLQAKLLVMAGFSGLVVWGIALVDSALILRGSGAALLGARLGITAIGTLLECGVCLGLAACFARLDEPQTSRNAAAPMWVHGGYWLSAVPIASLQWALEWLVAGPAARPPAVERLPASVLATSAVFLSLLLITPIVFVLTIGARRLARRE